MWNLDVHLSPHMYVCRRTSSRPSFRAGRRLWNRAREKPWLPAPPAHAHQNLSPWHIPSTAGGMTKSKREINVHYKRTLTRMNSYQCIRSLFFFFLIFYFADGLCLLLSLGVFCTTHIHWGLLLISRDDNSRFTHIKAVTKAVIKKKKIK